MKTVKINEDSKLLVIQNEERFYYVGKDYELVLACNKTKMIHQGQSFYLEKDQMLLLKPNQIYDIELRKQGVLILCCLFALPKVEYPYQFIHKIFQDDEIRMLIMSIVLHEHGGDIKKNLQLTSYRSSLAYALLNQFQLPTTPDENETFLNVREERMHRIFEYISEHYQEDITLVSLAKREHLTPQYLSKFFPTCFGMNFLSYLMNYRLEQSMKDIQSTNSSFLSIALKHGFPNVRSFLATFKQCFKETPSKYRQKYRSTLYVNVDADDKDLLQLFLTKQKNTMNKQVIIDNENSELRLHGDRVMMHAKHTWRTLLTVGRARLLLVEDIRKQIKEIQNDIGFSYIRFHGIFNEDMHVYDEDGKGVPSFDFTYINEALDFLYRVNLKPFIEFGFMPSKLADNPNLFILDGMFLVSKPKDNEKWGLLVREFLRNCINRYGLAEVRQWRFEFWNNPTLGQKRFDFDQVNRRFWQGSVAEYLSLYKITYDALKEMDSSFQMGGPGMHATQVLDVKGMMNYLQFMRRNHCFIDFFDLHLYPPLTMSNSAKIEAFRIEEFVHKQLDYVESFMKKNQLNIPLHITEWNLLFVKGSFNVSDSCYKAAYIVSTILENLDRFESLGYWTFSDYTETIKGDNTSVFNGNIGLFTQNGIRKAAYNAFVLLRKLGDNIIQKAPGYCFARKEKNYQLLLYRCSRHDKDIRESCKQTTYYVNYTAFEPGRYEKKTYYLNEHSGSSYDVWNAMGNHSSLMEEDVMYLKGHSMMSYTREEVFLDPLSFQESYIVKENELMLIEFIYKF